MKISGEMDQQRESQEVLKYDFDHLPNWQESSYEMQIPGLVKEKLYNLL